MKIEFLISHSINLCLKSLSDQVRRCFGLLFISNLGACDLLFLSKGRSVNLTSQLFQWKYVLLSLDNIYKLYYEFCQQDAGTNLSDQVRRWFGVLFTSNLEVCDLVFPSNWVQVQQVSFCTERVPTNFWEYCKSTNFGVLLYLTNLANCAFSLIFIAANIYVDRTLHRRAAGRRQI